MSKRIVLVSIFLTMLVSLVGMSASAIDASGATSFLYQGISYVPLKSTATFLGAPLRWDAAKGQAIITYKGEDFVLTPNSSKALYAGQSVVLSSPPVVINGVTYVPLETFKKYYNVPVEWDANKSEMKIKGPSGWRTTKASSRAPWHGGPPPWAPAWGQRGYGTPGHPSNVKSNVSGKAKGNRSTLVKGVDTSAHKAAKFTKRTLTIPQKNPKASARPADRSKSTLQRGVGTSAHKAGKFLKKTFTAPKKK